MKKIKNSKGGTPVTNANLDRAVDDGVFGAIVNIGGAPITEDASLVDIIKCVSEATTTADVYLNLLDIMVRSRGGDADMIIKGTMKKIRARHTELIRIKPMKSGGVVIEVSEEIPEIH